MFLGMINFYWPFLKDAANNQAILQEYLKGARKRSNGRTKLQKNLRSTNKTQQVQRYSRIPIQNRLQHSLPTPLIGRLPQAYSNMKTKPRNLQHSSRSQVTLKETIALTIENCQVCIWQVQKYLYIKTENMYPCIRKDRQSKEAKPLDQFTKGLSKCRKGKKYFFVQIKRKLVRIVIDRLKSAYMLTPNDPQAMSEKVDETIPQKRISSEESCISVGKTDQTSSVFQQ